MAGLRLIPRFPAARTKRRKLAPPPPRQHSNNHQVWQARCLRLRQLLAGAVNLARFRQALPLGTGQQQRGHIPAGDHAPCGYGPPEQRRPGHSLAQRNLLIVRGRRRLRAGDQLPAGMQTPSDGNRRNHCSRRFQHPAAMRLTFTWHRSPRAATPRDFAASFAPPSSHSPAPAAPGQRHRRHRRHRLEYTRHGRSLRVRAVCGQAQAVRARPRLALCRSGWRAARGSIPVAQPGCGAMTGREAWLAWSGAAGIGVTGLRSTRRSSADPGQQERDFCFLRDTLFEHQAHIHVASGSAGAP